ncbi:MAG: hypothetical protein ACXV3D_05325 [Halobacteriota archaeon]
METHKKTYYPANTNEQYAGRAQEARKLGVMDRDGIYTAKRPKGCTGGTFRRPCQEALAALDAEDDVFE